jgi:hypothetical protein
VFEYQISSKTLINEEKHLKTSSKTLKERLSEEESMFMNMSETYEKRNLLILID